MAHRRRRLVAAWLLTAFVALLFPAHPVAGEPVPRFLDKSYGLVPQLTLQVNFDGSVQPVGANWRGIPPAPGGSAPPLCSNGAAGPACSEFIVAPAVASNGISLKISATNLGLNVAFAAKLPFATTKTLTCVPLKAASKSGVTDIGSILARTGRKVGSGTSYDGGRAVCDLGTGFAYALSVEQQNLANVVPAGATGKGATHTLTIPWKLLSLNVHSTSILLALNVCALQADCEPDQVVVLIPIRVVDTSASVSAQYAPYVHTSQTPAPGATPSRIHDVGFDASYSWDKHDFASVAYAQDQSTVLTQRSLSQALSLTPLSVPMPGSQMSIAQTLQTRSQPLFSFPETAQMLNDDSLKPLFDLVPYSVTRIGSLSSGYTYGYNSPAVKFAGIYGNQAQGWYTGAETVTLAVTTPAPSPEPSLPPLKQRTAAVEAIPLKAPPPPAPFFESNTANDLPAQVTFVNGYAGSKGFRDGITGIAANAHLYQNDAATYAGYQATTVDVFGRYLHDLYGPDGGTAKSTTSQFIGESTSFTTSMASTTSTPGFFQFKETIGTQIDDKFFSPSAGSSTWVTALNGPIVHITTSYASGDSARYYALDLVGFRLTNVYGDVATQEGWQVSLPVPKLTGWILTGGSLTQTVSDRIAVLEQGLVQNYASAVPEVEPTPGKDGAVPLSTIRPQFLGNSSLLSPWIPLTHPSDVQIQLVGGYNFGDVTGCGTTAKSTPKKTLYACQTQKANHGVGGLFFRLGNDWTFGATDTSALPGSISAGGAARNLGTNGGLPGSVTGFLSYSGCPKISAAYTNAAFPSGVPLPQQGNTLSAEVDYPISIRAFQLDAAGGYFNEHTLSSSGSSTSGGFLAFRLTLAHPRNPRC